MKLPCPFTLRWLALCLLALPSLPVFADSAVPKPALNPAKLKELNDAVAAAVHRREVPGAVVLLEHGAGRWTNQFGNRSVDPVARPMVAETIFDAASLTKVMATAPAIMLLVEEEKLELDAPASRWLTEFKGEGKEKITLRQMLTHMSGLRPGIQAVGGGWNGYEAGIARAMAEPVFAAPNTEFRYSDLNFILLGEIVRRVAGEPLNRYVDRRIFQPLAMRDTFYQPAASKRDRIAPTAREGGVLVHGVVHDPTARLMGGIAGHAGLFTNIRDTGRFCHMLLNKGKSRDGRVIMKEETVKAMTAVQPTLPGGIRRTLGFDVSSPFAGSKGAYFGPRSYGHTGFTGCCFWIDPDAGAYYVLLTNRNHLPDGGNVLNLRWEVATLAAEAMGVPRQVVSGTDHLLKNGLTLLEGKKIGLITNQTGLATDGTATLAALQKVPGAKVVRLFSPEHGIAGKLDHEGITDSIDESSGLPVSSLYGDNRKPTPASLEGLDVLVFDIQDIGTRFYTYISTMLNCMEAAAAAKLPFVVLDRVNPLGSPVEGPLPIDVKNTFVACHDIPIRHGLTIGELAQLFARERTPGIQLTVVPVTDWQRHQIFSQTMAPWVNPSPNMRSPEAALLYPGIGLLEFSNISVGRGTDAPFKYLGAPWIDAPALLRRLGEMNPEGVSFELTSFTPTSSVFSGELCHGLKLTVTNPRLLRPVRLGIAIAKALHDQHGTQYQLDKVNTLLFHPPTLQAIRDKKPLREITALWHADESAFRRRSEAVQLYP